MDCNRYARRCGGAAFVMSGPHLHNVAQERIDDTLLSVFRSYRPPGGMDRNRVLLANGFVGVHIQVERIVCLFDGSCEWYVCRIPLPPPPPLPPIHLRAVADTRALRRQTVVADALLQLAIGQPIDQHEILRRGHWVDVVVMVMVVVVAQLVAGGRLLQQLRAERAERFLGQVLQAQTHVDDGQEGQRHGGLHVEPHRGELRWYRGVVAAWKLNVDVILTGALTMRSTRCDGDI